MTELTDLWATLRASRSEPPVPAQSKPRASTYVFGLEQAEQLLKAAEHVSPATQPILLFYGLSQAGRSIAAAARSLTKGDWMLSGHGIASKSSSNGIQDLKVHAEGGARASFICLSQLLDSPIPDEQAAISLDRLWDSIPENLEWPLVKSRNRRVPLGIGTEIAPHGTKIQTVVWNFPSNIAQAPNVRSELDEYMKSYPYVTDFSYQRITGNPESDPHLRKLSRGDIYEIDFFWDAPSGQWTPLEERRKYLMSMSRNYCGTSYLFPAVAGNSKSMHPLMTWWAVLFALSILARYEPTKWANFIDVDRSMVAVPIERLMSEAIRVIPRLIMQTLQEVQS